MTAVPTRKHQTTFKEDKKTLFFFSPDLQTKTNASGRLTRALQNSLCLVIGRPADTVEFSCRLLLVQLAVVTHVAHHVLGAILRDANTRAMEPVGAQIAPDVEPEQQTQVQGNPLTHANKADQSQTRVLSCSFADAHRHSFDKLTWTCRTAFCRCSKVSPRQPGTALCPLRSLSVCGVWRWPRPARTTVAAGPPVRTPPLPHPPLRPSPSGGRSPDVCVETHVDGRKLVHAS